MHSVLRVKFGQHINQQIAWFHSSLFSLGSIVDLFQHNFIELKRFSKKSVKFDTYTGYGYVLHKVHMQNSLTEFFAETHSVLRVKFGQHINQRIVWFHSSIFSLGNFFDLFQHSFIELKRFLKKSVKFDADTGYGYVLHKAHMPNSLTEFFAGTHSVLWVKFGQQINQRKAWFCSSLFSLGIIFDFFQHNFIELKSFLKQSVKFDADTGYGYVLHKADVQNSLTEFFAGTHSVLRVKFGQHINQ